MKFFNIFFTNNRIRPFKKSTQIYFLFKLDEEPLQRQKFDSNFDTKIVDFLNLISSIFAETTYLLCLRCDKNNIFPHFCFSTQRGEEGQPHQSLVRTTFSSFLVRTTSKSSSFQYYFFKCPILENKYIFKNMATLGHKT